MELGYRPADQPAQPDAPLLGANRLFRSDDRGDSWTAVSGDLTSGVDRNRLDVMGTVWSIDAVAKNRSTSFYGNIVALDESPLEEGVLYVGTDDGLVQVTRDGGRTWTRTDQVGDAPRAVAGAYTVELHRRARGDETLLAGPVAFEVRDLVRNPLAGDQEAKLAFELELQDTYRRVEAATREHRLAVDRLQRLRTAAAIVAGPEMQARIGALEDELRAVWSVLDGDATIAQREEPTPMPVRERLGRISWSLRATTMGPTQTQRQSLAIAAQEFAAVAPDLARLVDEEIPALVAELEVLGAPFTGGGDHLVPDNDGGDEARRWRRY
ncbi:MAG: hypothetical protein PHQ53_00965 [Candidatus Krumholzibacteria bacterium]|nr:hypothetical protein [Candidatus Krumholzibacteria bacterium]